MDANAAEAAFQRGVSLQESGDLRGAATEFARATDLDNSDSRFWIARGVALLELRHFKEAARCLKAGLDLKPHYGEADARVWLGDALWLAGQRKEAERQWLAASKMHPMYPGYSNPIDEAKRRLAEAVQHDVAADGRPASLRSGGRPQLNVNNVGQLQVRRQPRKPTAPYGTLSFSKDGRVSKHLFRLPDQKEAQEEAAFAQFTHLLETCHGMGPFGVQQLPQAGHDFALSMGSRLIEVQLTELVQRDYVRAVTLPELKALLREKGEIHFVDQADRTFVIDGAKKDGALRDRIAAKVDKYKRPGQTPLWLVIFTTDTYILEFVRAKTLFMTKALELARDYIRGAEPFVFSEVWFSDLMTAPIRIWPAPAEEPPVDGHA